MKLPRWLSALLDGAGSISLMPALPDVEMSEKTAAQAFAEDAEKLLGDYARAWGTSRQRR